MERNGHPLNPFLDQLFCSPEFLAEPRSCISTLRALTLGTLLASVVLGWTGFAHADPIWQVTIQPIHICDDAGANCANDEEQLWEAEGDKIWAQAGIDLQFLPWTNLNETDFTFLQSNEFHDILAADPPAYGGSADPTVLNIWFANVFGTAYGAAECDGCRNIALSWTIVQGHDRQDTIGHEIGHTLGLLHATLAGGPKNLMAAGQGRTIPHMISDIFPDGARLDQLDEVQIDVALSSPFVKPIPEPAALSLLGVALAGTLACRPKAQR